jgi:hypothetical protein
MLVRLKNSSPRNPMTITMAATRKANTTESKAQIPQTLSGLILFSKTEIEALTSESELGARRELKQP